MFKEKAIGELHFKAVRSSGAGGQNVNKVSSKVLLSFDLAASAAFSEAEKQQLNAKLANRISADGILQLQCDEDRSQLRNKDIVTRRFLTMIEQALAPVRIRKQTKVPKSVIRKRIKDKKNQSERKKLRQRPDF